MIITISFLSGELRELNVPSAISCIYNVKAIMCDEFKELKNYEPQNIYLYDIHNKEMDRFDSVVEGEIYRVLIVQDKRYVIYLDNEYNYAYCKNIDDDADVRRLSENEIKSMYQTDTVEYFFNMKTFRKAWFEEENFFKRYGYLLRNNDENDDVYNIYPSEDEYDEEEYDENSKKVECRTRDCLGYIFSGIRPIRIVYDVIYTHIEN